MTRVLEKVKPSFVALADLHAHVWSAFAQGDGAANSRLKRTLQVLDASLQDAETLKVPWLFGGDIVHTAGFALNVVLSELIEVFKRYPKVQKLAVWGNHDARGVGGRILLNQTVWGALQEAVPNLLVLDPSLQDRPKLINGMFYSGAGAQPKPELFRYAEPSDVGLYHGTVAGSIGPNGYVFERGLDPKELLERHRFVVVGDIHQPQTRDDSPRGRAILVPGSPEHHNFGDQGDHGWWIVTMLGTDDPTVEFVPSNSPQFLTVEHAREVKVDGNYYRVRDLAANEALPEGAQVIAPTPTTVLQRDALHGAHGGAILDAWLGLVAPPDGLDAHALVALGRELLSQEEATQLQPYRLTGLYLHNFCSYAEQHFDVRTGTWLVVGSGRDFQSNGAGKTTLFEALFWLLFGRTSKGLTGDEVIRWGTTACGVAAIFQAPDQTELRVTRTRGERSGLEVDEGGQAWEATSVGDMTAKLSRRLGLTPELFQALGYFSQERLLLFASASDGERKDMLTDLIGLGAYQAASAAAAGRAAEYAQSMTRKGALQEAAETQSQREWLHLNKLSATLQLWETNHAMRLGGAEAVLAEFDGRSTEARAQLLAVARAEMLDGLDQRRVRIKERRATYEQTLEDNAPGHSLADVESVRRQLLEATTMTAQAKGTVSELQRQLNEARRILEQQEQELQLGVCPMCRQPVTAAHREQCLDPSRQVIAMLTGKLQASEQLFQHALQTAADLKPMVETVEKGWAVTQMRTRLRAALEELAEEEDALKEEQTRLERTAEQHVTKVLEDKRREISAITERIRAEINPHAAEEVATRDRIAQATKARDQYAAELAEMKLAQAACEYWQKGFSKQGIQSLLVDEVAALFNQHRGSIFPELTQGVYDVQFSTRSQTKGGEWRERTEFQVYERGEPIPYAALSGGQRRRIDVGVMLTLVTAVSAWFQVPGALGVLVLDEVFGFLDQSGAEGLAEALREVQATIPAIYVVSHDQALQALFSDIVFVEQDQDGISHITAGADDGSDESGDDRDTGRQQTDVRGSHRKRGSVRDPSARHLRSGEGAGVDGHPLRHGLLDLAHGDGD